MSLLAQMRLSKPCKLIKEIYLYQLKEYLTMANIKSPLKRTNLDIHTNRSKKRVNSPKINKIYEQCQELYPLYELFPWKKRLLIKYSIPLLANLGFFFLINRQTGFTNKSFIF